MPFGEVVIVCIAIALKLLEILLCEGLRLKDGEGGERVLLIQQDLLLERLLSKSLKKLLV
jgi:hypothetical protein